MATIAPGAIACVWDGESFTPANPHWAKRADQLYTVGETYSLDIREDRSTASHRQYFAAIAEAWGNLPDDAAERFPTFEHLRKWALIRAGYRDERSIVCSSKAEARRVKAFIRPMDEYAVVLARDAVVIVYTAQSQSMRAMGKAEFQRSKDKVLDVIAELIGTTRKTLARNTGAAA